MKELGSEVYNSHFKGVRTAEYRIKAKLMKAIYGITIRETGRKSRPPKPAKRAA